MFKPLLSFLLLTAGVIAQAETFLGMEPLEPLSSIKQRYTAARLVTEPADWLKPHQYFGRLTTDEVSGSLLLLFEHDDEARKKKAHRAGKDCRQPATERACALHADADTSAERTSGQTAG